MFCRCWLNNEEHTTFNLLCSIPYVNTPFIIIPSTSGSVITDNLINNIAIILTRNLIRPLTIYITSDKIIVLNCPCARADIPIRFTDFRLTGADADNYQLTNAQPEGVTAEIHPTPNYLDLSGYPDFDNEENVTVNGRTYPIGTDGGRYVNLPETGDILQRFTYLNGTYSAAHENYPTGMTAYRIIRQEGGAKLERIDGLDDLLIYSGCSIRISGKQGIRMITGITQDNKKALTGKTGLAGYTLEEYGTLICWNTDVTSGDDFSLDMSCARHNYAYLKGKADPVFARQDGKTLYTNVLVGFSLEDCAKDLVLRPYIKLKDMTTGETVTLYGGSVCRSIGYIAKQNADTYKPGSSGYKYVHKIIDAVYDQEP